LIERLVDEAVGNAAGGTALDLYCGAGLFSLPLAAAFTHVIGIDAESRAIDLARSNAKQNRVDNARFECSPVESALQYASLPRHVDFVLLDPPRTGIGEAVVERIAALSPAHVRSVSCDPATLARDVECVARLVPSATAPTRSTARSSD
jgi:23S rRNA (uracil1939-C5)-methyltransferase